MARADQATVPPTIVFQIERVALVSWGDKKSTGVKPVGLPSRLPRDGAAIKSG